MKHTCAACKSTRVMVYFLRFIKQLICDGNPRSRGEEYHQERVFNSKKVPVKLLEIEISCRPCLAGVQPGHK